MGRHAAKVVERVDIDALGGGNLEDADLLPNPSLRGHDRSARYHKGAGLRVIGREPLAVEALGIVRVNGAIIIFAPRKTRFVNDRNQSVQILIDGLFNCRVERLHGQRWRGRLHSHDIVPFGIGRHGVGDNGIKCYVVSTESCITPVNLRTHLLGNNAHCGRIGSYNDMRDVVRGKCVVNRVVYERMTAYETDILIRDAL